MLWRGMFSSSHFKGTCNVLGDEPMECTRIKVARPSSRKQNLTHLLCLPSHVNATGCQLVLPQIKNRGPPQLWHLRSSYQSGFQSACMQALPDHDHMIVMNHVNHSLQVLQYHNVLHSTPGDHLNLSGSKIEPGTNQGTSGLVLKDSTL
jgi:hypothetical protein